MLNCDGLADGNLHSAQACCSCVAISSCDAISVSGITFETGTHIRGEIVRRRIASKAERAVGEITGQFHARNQSRVVTFHSPAAVH